MIQHLSQTHEIAAAWVQNGGSFMIISALMIQQKKGNLAIRWAYAAIFIMLVGSVIGVLP